MKRKRIIAGVALLALLSWAGYRAWMAHLDLVTLNVHDMEVHQVASKLEWQTWEQIVVSKGVGGNVTLNVRRVPLDQVLDIIALQTSSKWTALYPIYSARAAADKLTRVLTGDVPIPGSGWTNLQKIPLARWGGPGGNGGFGNNLRAANKVVSAQIEGKDLGFAAMALSRFSRAVVVPEDSASGTVHLKLEQAPFEKAVALVAHQVHRKWDKIYAIEPSRGVITVAKNAPATNSVTNAPADSNKVASATQVKAVPVMTAQPQAAPSPEQQQRQMEAFLATMTPEERQKMQQQMAASAEMNSLPPAERQQRMQAMAAEAKSAAQANIEQRIEIRLRDGTVSQRIAHDREVLKRQQQRAQAK